MRERRRGFWAGGWQRRRLGRRWWLLCAAVQAWRDRGDSEMVERRGWAVGVTWAARGRSFLSSLLHLFLLYSARGLAGILVLFWLFVMVILQVAAWVQRGSRCGFWVWWWWFNCRFWEWLIWLWAWVLCNGWSHGRVNGDSEPVIWWWALGLRLCGVYELLKLRWNWDDEGRDDMVSEAWCRCVVRWWFVVWGCARAAMVWWWWYRRSSSCSFEFKSMVQAGKQGAKDCGIATAPVAIFKHSAKRKKKQTKPFWLSVINRKKIKIKLKLNNKSNNNSNNKYNK